jgi:hypothetical protein
MNREELKEIIGRIVEKLEEEAPRPACIFGDSGGDCDMTTRYAIGEEG